ncbi:MAG: sulfatase [Acidobacteriota bacterium]
MIAGATRLAARSAAVAVVGRWVSILSLALYLTLSLTACGSAERPSPAGAEPLGARRADAPPNVLIVSLDALRADRLGSYGHTRDTSPFLDALARQGTRYSRAFVNTHGTPPSHATLWTGLYQETHGVSMPYADGAKRGPRPRDRRDDRLPPELPIVPAALRDAGYATLGFSGGGFLSRDFGFDRGFDVWHESLSLQRAGQRLLAELERQRGHGRPLFVFLHTYDIHSPYEAPRRWRRAFGALGSAHLGTTRSLQRLTWTRVEPDGPIADRLGRLYDAGIRHADETLERLFGHLERRGFLHRTLIIVTSDHGEELGDHRGVLHPATLFDELLHVPLIVVGPGVEAGKVEEAPVSTVDLTATLYAAARVEPAIEPEGRDLLAAAELPRSRAVFSQYARRLYSLRTPRYKLVHVPESGRSRLFDLRTDPDERLDVARQRPELTAHLLGRLERLRIQAAERALEVRTEASGGRPLAPETRRRLEALGYF